MLRRQRFVTTLEANPVTSVNTEGLPIGRALKVERVAAGLTSTAVAAAIGISIGHLSRIEKGERTASPELIEKIREAVRTTQA